VDDGVQPVVLEGLPVVLGLPYLDVVQSALGPAGHQRPEMYQLLVIQRGWSPERHEHFLVDAWQRLLLAGCPRASPRPGTPQGRAGRLGEAVGSGASKWPGWPRRG
jgi:hypothetical protein